MRSTGSKAFDENAQPRLSAAATGLGLNTIGAALYRMAKAGAVTKSGRGRYAATTPEGQSRTCS